MNSLNNSVRLLGNVGMDPEVITFDSGNKLAKFSLSYHHDRKKRPRQARAIKRMTPNGTKSNHLGQRGGHH